MVGGKRGQMQIIFKNYFAAADRSTSGAQQTHKPPSFRSISLMPLLIFCVFFPKETSWGSCSTTRFSDRASTMRAMSRLHSCLMQSAPPVASWTLVCIARQVDSIWTRVMCRCSLAAVALSSQTRALQAPAEDDSATLLLFMDELMCIYTEAVH